jgi:hypothetical protein
MAGCEEFERLPSIKVRPVSSNRGRSLPSGPGEYNVKSLGFQYADGHLAHGRSVVGYKNSLFHYGKPARDDAVSSAEAVPMSFQF